MLHGADRLGECMRYGFLGYFFYLHNALLITISYTRYTSMHDVCVFIGNKVFPSGFLKTFWRRRDCCTYVCVGGSCTMRPFLFKSAFCSSIHHSWTMSCPIVTTAYAQQRLRPRHPLRSSVFELGQRGNKSLRPLASVKPAINAVHLRRAVVSCSWG